MASTATAFRCVMEGEGVTAFSRLALVLACGAGVLLFVGAGAREAAAQTCRDDFYGGCPDSCTTDFKRLTETGQLTEAALQSWAEICLKTTEAPEARQQPQAEPQEESESGAASRQGESSAQDSQEQQSEATQQSQESQQAQQSQQEQQSQQGQQAGPGEQAQPSRPAQQSTQPAQAPGESQQAQSSAPEQASAQTPEQAEESSQAQPSGQEDNAAELAEEAQQAGADASGQSAGAEGQETSPAAQPSGGASAGSPETGQGEAGGSQGVTASQPPAGGRTGSEAVGGAAGDATGAAEAAGGEDAGTPPPAGTPSAAEAAPSPSPAGAANRPGTPATQQAQESRAPEDFVGPPVPERAFFPPEPAQPGPPAPANRTGSVYGGRQQVSGPLCGQSAAPMCGGFCDAGICVPDGAGAGCSCQPAQPPSVVQNRRRALCPIPGQNALRVDVCRAAGLDPDANCLAAFDDAAAVPGGQCTTVWSKPWSEISALAGGRGDLDLRIGVVPIWDWKRPGEAVDHVTVPLAGARRNSDPKTVWESVPAPLPFSDIRLLIGSRKSGKVALLRPVGTSRIEVAPTRLELGDLKVGCESTQGRRCADDDVARLRLALVAQAPETRILAQSGEAASDWSGECAAIRLDGVAQVLCYQVRKGSADTARAWSPVQFDWAEEGAGARYAEGLIGERELSPAERRFFARAAGTSGDSPALVLALASTADKQVHDRGGLDFDAGRPRDAGEAYGFLALDDGELFAITGEGESRLPGRTAARLVDILSQEHEGSHHVARILASAAISDGDLLLLGLNPDVGACFRRTLPRPRISCFHVEGRQIFEWDPIDWASGEVRPLVDRKAIFAALARDRSGRGPLADPFLDRFFAAATQREARHIRLYDMFSDPASGTGWSGVALAFLLADPAARPLLQSCREDGVILAGRNPDPIRLDLRVVETEGLSCREGFDAAWQLNREEIRSRLGAMTPSEIVSLAMRGDRALLKTLTPARTELLNFWASEEGERRLFPGVTAACLLERARAARHYAPSGTEIDERDLVDAFLDPDWRSRGWRANPLGLILRAESCEVM